MTTKLMARAGIALLAASASANAPAVTPFMDIASAGPLIHVYLGNELSCQVAHILDGTTLEFFPPNTIPGDCGTFIAMGGTLYAPDFDAHGSTATSGLGPRVVFTPISQTGVTGTGIAADPFKVVTVVDVSTTGLRIQQTDTYVVGDASYRTEVMITNSGGPASGVLYRAGDAFLGGSNNGYGFTEVFDTRKAVGCSVNPNNMPPGRIEEWVPLTGDNNFYQNNFNSVWTFIGTKAPFPDTCTCTTLLDNGAGISWNFSIPAGGSATFSHVTTFSPFGLESLVTSKTADSPTSVAGSQNGYTITIENPNPNPVTLSSITDTLPAGFSYVSGSTTGVTTSDPIISAQMLTWTGPFVVAASSSVSLHFAVIVASMPGDYLNEAGGEAAGGFTVIGTGPTARITVTPTPAPPATGFVIGDLNAVIGNHVTFWGAQWAKKNSLSGGPAPSSFKGYANSPNPNPPACGGTWNSDPGNSSGPPASVSAFMTVIVSSSITKSGSMISGNIPEMVIVQTDPGYAPNPGHAGTGTVTEVVCGSGPATAACSLLQKRLDRLERRHQRLKRLHIPHRKLKKRLHRVQLQLQHCL